MVLQGVSGLSYRGDIAVDDIHFTNNLWPCTQNGTVSADENHAGEKHKVHLDTFYGQR